MTTWIKCCCIMDAWEAQTAIDLGVDAVGLVSHMPSGPGVLDERTLQRVRNAIGDAVEVVLLTSRQGVSELSEAISNLRPDCLQLCAPVEDEVLAQLKTLQPECLLMPVVHITGIESVSKGLQYRCADRLLADSGSPNAAVAELGGTGRTHDWTITAGLVDQNEVPTALAGGLRSDNVRAALDTVKPWGVDVCSGVRTDGKLDPAKLEQFVKSVRTYK